MLTCLSASVNHTHLSMHITTTNYSIQNIYPQTLPFHTYLNDGAIWEPEKMAVQLLKPTGINSVHGNVGSNPSWTNCRCRNFILRVGVTAGDTGAGAMAFAHVIVHCHLVRPREPPRSPMPRKKKEEEEETSS